MPLFTSQFWPKTANCNLSETELLVFAIKRVFFFSSYGHILGEPKEAYCAFRWLCFKICVTLICFHNIACKKTFRMKSSFSQKKEFVNFICFEHKKMASFFLDKAKLSILSWKIILYIY